MKINKSSETVKTAFGVAKSTVFLIAELLYTYKVHNLHAVVIINIQGFCTIQIWYKINNNITKICAESLRNSVGNHLAWPCIDIVTVQEPCWPYTRIGIGRIWMLCPRFIGIPLAISQCRHGFDINHHIRFLGVSRGQLFKLQKFMPLIMTTVVPSLILAR